MLHAAAMQGFSNHFILEWDTAIGIQGAKVGPHAVSHFSKLTGNVLEPKDNNAPLLGFCTDLLPEKGAASGRRLTLVATKFASANNPDGSACKVASPEILNDLAALSGKPARRAKAQKKPTSGKPKKKPEPT